MEIQKHQKSYIIKPMRLALSKSQRRPVSVLLLYPTSATCPPKKHNENKSRSRLPPHPSQPKPPPLSQHQERKSGRLKHTLTHQARTELRLRRVPLPRGPVAVKLPPCTTGTLEARYAHASRCARLECALHVMNAGCTHTHPPTHASTPLKTLPGTHTLQARNGS